MPLDPKKLKSAKSKARREKLVKQAQSLIKAATSRPRSGAQVTEKEGEKKEKTTATLKFLKGIKDGVGVVSRKRDAEREKKRLELKKATIPNFKQKTGGGARQGFTK